MSISTLYHARRTAVGHARATTLLLGTLLLANTACTPPPDTPTDKPAEPQVTQLRDAMQKPLDSAHAAQQTLDDGAARQRQAIEDAGG
ncbi:MAG: hypothetical protein ACTIJY_05125 [Luteimonas sp.]